MTGPAELTEFRVLFASFRDLSDEFLSLSHLTEKALERFGHEDGGEGDEHSALHGHFCKLQVAVLQQVIATNLRLLRVFDDCLRCGENLPYGAYEIFIGTVRVLAQARGELERPRYAAMLDQAALRNADRVDRLLKTLIAQSPQLAELV